MVAGTQYIPVQVWVSLEYGPAKVPDTMECSFGQVLETNVVVIQTVEVGSSVAEMDS